MKKIKDEIKILNYLKQGCNTIASISQYKYAKYLVRSNTVKEIIKNLKNEFLDEEKQYADEYFLILFISFIDSEVHKLFNKYDHSKIFVIASAGIIKILESSYKDFESTEIDLRKMRSFNTEVYEKNIVSKIVDFIKLQSGTPIIYFMKSLNFSPSYKMHSMKFWTNIQKFSIMRVDLYYHLLSLLSLLYISEYTNNKNAVEKINDMILSKKIQLKKTLGKSINYYNLI